MKIVIADDHAILRTGLVALLEGQSAWKVVAEVDRVSGIRPAVEASRPDVLVADYALPDGDSYATVCWLRERYGLRVVMLTGVNSPLILSRLVASKLDALLHKTGDISELVDAVETVALGRRYVSEAIEARAQASEVMLSPRETQVLTMIVRGMGRACIAQQLNLSPETIKSHRKRLMGKLEVSSTAALIEKSLALGLVTNTSGHS